ncbi:MAG TPA: nucleotidyltransferase family protein, partial [bacterium]|nr:nucleotidyltransferase family protein [bacterium]
HQLKKQAADLLPSDELALLRDLYLRNSGHNFRLLHESKKLVKAFADANITMIPFKGPLLGEMVYGDCALRKASNDLDIVVREDDIQAASEILHRAGYHLCALLTGKQLQKQIHLRYHIAFSNHHGVHLELHWHTVPRYLASFSMPEVFDHCLQVSAADIFFFSFASDDLFLLLCQHAAKDFWLSLSMVCDLNELLPHLDTAAIEPLLHKSRSHGRLRMVLVGFYLVHALLKTSLPQAVERQISLQPKIRQIGDAISERLFEAKKKPTETGYLLNKYRFFWAMQERKREKMRMLFEKLRQLPGV